MSHDHGHEKQQQSEIDRVHVEPAAMDGSNERALTADPDELFKEVEHFAKTGKGKPKDLVRLLKALDQTNQIKASELLPDLTKHLSGDEALQVGEVLHERLDFRIENALKSKKPVSEEKLKTYLRGVSPADLAWLGDNAPILEKVKKLFPGPLTVELPQLAEFPSEIHEKPLLVTWWLNTTDKTVAASQISYKGGDALVATLDQLNEWSWLDHLHIGTEGVRSVNLAAMRDLTTNAKAKEKLTKLVDAHKEDQGVATKAVKTDLDTNASTDQLLSHAANADDLRPYAGELSARMKTESSSANLEFSVSTGQDLKSAIPALANAKGVTADQMFHLLIQQADPDARAHALTDDTVRKHVQKILGKDFPLSSLFPDWVARNLSHTRVAGNKALREWAYQENNPLTTLWVAAGGESAEKARESCKQVKREAGYDFAKKLPPTAPDAEVRRFIHSCGDEKLGQWLRQHVLADREVVLDDSWNEQGEVGPYTYGNDSVYNHDRRRLDEAIVNDSSPETVLARLADMGATERSALMNDDGEMKRMFATLGGADLQRAVFLLGPSVSQLLKLPIKDEPALLDYMRTRPGSEEETALGKASLVTNARSMFPRISPLVIFATLADPGVMAKALTTSPGLLEWLLEDTEPSLALACLARDDVRKVAAPIFEKRKHMYDKLPQYEHLLGAGKKGFDALAKDAKKESKRDEAEEYQDGDHAGSIDKSIDERAEKMSAASGKAHLWDAITHLTKERGGEKAMIALVNNASAKERIELLDGSHTDAVENLKSVTSLSPHHIFPSLTTAQLLSLPDAASWLFEAEQPYAILTRIANDTKGLKQLGKFFDAHVSHAHMFVGKLPEGAGLTAKEHHALDQLIEHVSNQDVLRALFKARFGTTVDTAVETGFSAAEIKQLWVVLERLPPAQVNQNVIRQFTHQDLGQGRVVGLWNHQDVVLHSNRQKQQGDDKAYDDTPWLTKDEIKKYYGLDDDKLKQATAAKGGWITEDHGKYKMNPIPLTRFDSTVLHEVGHSVEELLGDHASLVFGAGGWKRYGVDQFEDWAGEMGALKDIKGDDKREVVSAWKDSLRSGTPITELVDENHPARATTYEKDPLVAATRSGRTFDYAEDDRQALNGRVFTTDGVTLSSVPKQTADCAPSEYAMKAPAEYFAECYVEYYRQYNGQPDTEKDKGGRLAKWIKDWFTQNVDKIKFSPQHLQNIETKEEESKKSS